MMKINYLEYLKYINLLTNQIDKKTIKSLSKTVKEIPLVIESPQDYEYFTLKQQELISTQLDGARKKK